MLQCEKLKAEAATLPGIRAELEALRQRHSAALELMGERDEEVHAFLFCILSHCWQTKFYIQGYMMKLTDMSDVWYH